MTNSNTKPEGPDLRQGIAESELADGAMLAGHAGGDAVLLVRRGKDVFAVGAHCTHYGAPLADGLVDGTGLHCPWHHALFDLATGEARHAPAISPLGCWAIERREGKVYVGAKREAAKAPARTTKGFAKEPDSIVVVGGGAAGFAAAEMLRRQGYSRKLVMLSSDSAAPVDRPNLSKDYLAGKAPQEWVPLRGEEFYSENEIELRLDTAVAAIEPRAHEVVLDNGARVRFDRLLLATGAEPNRPAIPGAELPHVRLLRSLADCRAIIERLAGTRRAVVLGASFIGLEVAAALRERGIEVHVLAPEAKPMERILGHGLGDFVRKLHEEHGVIFHLGKTASGIDRDRVTLADGSRLDADLVVAGLGVRPRTALAERAGLAIDRGVAVDRFLETNAPGIFAAGDIARWPDPHSGENIRVEHWVVAERQGQAAALNLLGERRAFTAVPFFWSQHYDIPINYVGHAEKWDAIEIEGSIDSRDCLLRYKQGGRLKAVASIFRDRECLEAEIAMEKKA
jgi:NADPH-dependent 2,4-dienoyl-CoA reductase/sulfur reductase-like enzyme/nitrite reductase/ring-hydroxylating ferredoxin subunit